MKEEEQAVSSFTFGMCHFSIVSCAYGVIQTFEIVFKVFNHFSMHASMDEGNNLFHFYLYR